MSHEFQPRSADSLGKPIYSHRPSRANVIAGIVLGLLCVGGGIALASFHVMRIRDGYSPNWQMYFFDWGGVGVLFIGGVALLVWMRNLIGFRIYVCPDGFFYVRRGRTHVFAWEDIREVHEMIRQEPLLPARGVAKAVAPTRVRRSYRIKRRDGLTFKVGVNTLPHISLLGGPLKAAAQRLDIDWHAHESSGEMHVPKHND